jgi:hypothetical protein
MYLIHNTKFKYLINILEDSELKSNKLCNILNEGYGIYQTNNFIYFSTTNRVFDNNDSGQCIMYFKSNMINNKTFYLAHTHLSSPNQINIYKNKQQFDKFIKKYPRLFKHRDKK